MRAYAAAFSMRLKMELQYRAAALGGILCQIFFGLVLIALYRALYASRPQTLPIGSVVTYVWINQAFFRMLLSWDTDLLDKLRTGAIAYDLCRPVSLYGYYYARIAAMKLVGSLLRAVPMLLFAILLPEGWRVGPPVSAGALAAAFAGLGLGLACVTAMECVTMGITMRTIDHRGVMALLNLLMVTFSGNLLPLTLFPDSWQRVITLLPYAQLLDAPIRLYTGERPLSAAPGILGLQALWTLALAALGLWIWRHNLRRITIQGG
ncbi:MAG: ABC-2 family transporter protein [Clostridia bacterium]|nr:ABC-2 family transporter protein [Clostridia bacterium]